MTTSIVLLLLLVPLSAIMLYRTWRIAHAVDRLSLLSDDVTGGCESIGFIGISAVCSRPAEMKQISALLGQEYKRYEVIVVMDSEQQSHMLQSIITRYKLIRVNCTPSTELPSQIRQLYRSRQRGFRRLIVVDTPHKSLYEDINAGVAIASFDHILPLDSRSTLYPKAIESLAIMLSEEEFRHSPYTCSRTDGATLFRRDAIVRCGGLAPLWHQLIGKGHKTYTPIIRRDLDKSELFSFRSTIILLLAALLIMKSAIENSLTTIPIMLIILALTIAAICRAKLLTAEKCSLWDILYHFRQMTRIFPSRKFII